MTHKIRRSPVWIRKLRGSERVRAWAIYLFVQYDAGVITNEADLIYFTQCVERAEWPVSGYFPRVSPEVAAKLSIDDPKWAPWRRFSTLRSLLSSTMVSPRKKLLSSS